MSASVRDCPPLSEVGAPPRSAMLADVRERPPMSDAHAAHAKSAKRTHGGRAHHRKQFPGRHLGTAKRR
jgi:hypothetical protein